MVSKRSKKNLLVLTSWKFFDGLTQGAALPYVALIRDALPADTVIHIFTLEAQKPTAVEDARVAAQLAPLKAQWVPFVYGKFSVGAMLRYAWVLFDMTLYVRRNQIKVLHAICSPIGGFAYLLSLLTGAKLVVDSYEPHAETMVEVGEWKAGGLKHRVLSWLQRCQTRRGVAFLGSAPAMPEYVAQAWQTPLRPDQFFAYKPCCVPLDEFYPDEALRNQTRAALNIPEGTKVGIYVGKFGGRYLRHEIFEIMSHAFRQLDGNFRFIILSNHSDTDIAQMAQQADLPAEVIQRLFVPHSEVNAYLNAADFAISPFNPSPTMYLSGPVKNGEYWAAGLPVLIPPRISIDSDIITQSGLGAVFEPNDSQSQSQAVDYVLGLLRENPWAELRQRVRQLAYQHRNYEIVKPYYQKLYSPGGLLGF